MLCNAVKNTEHHGWYNRLLCFADTFVGMDQAAMIQINCEVHSTNYVKIDRELLAGVGYPASKSSAYDRNK